MEEELDVLRVKAQLEDIVRVGGAEYFEAQTGRDIHSTLKELDDASLVYKANHELKRRNGLLYYSSGVLGVLMLAFAFSTLALLLKGVPNCQPHQFNTNHRGTYCYGPGCYR